MPSTLTSCCRRAPIYAPAQYAPAEIAHGFRERGLHLSARRHEELVHQVPCRWGRGVNPPAPMIASRRLLISHVGSERQGGNGTSTSIVESRSRRCANFSWRTTSSKGTEPTLATTWNGSRSPSGT